MKLGVDTSLGITPLTRTAAAPVGMERPSVPVASGGWTELVKRFERVASGNAGAGSAPPDRSAQLTDLLKLQIELGRYQLRVELIAKVADSALVTVRKLQQQQ